jgi:hypothetical protein
MMETAVTESETRDAGPAVVHDEETVGVIDPLTDQETQSRKLPHHCKTNVQDWGVILH